MYIETEAGAEALSEEDMYLVSSFYEEAILGVMLRWLQEANTKVSEEDLKARACRIRQLFKGQLHLLIANSRKEEE